MNEDKNNTVKTFLSFLLGDEVFAINVTKVINILEVSHVTRVPKAPVYMKGVVNLRGTVLPVVDLRLKFGLPETQITINSSIIVLNLEMDGEQFLVGALVDAVREVLELKESDIAPSPSIGTKYKSGFIEGMWRINESFIMILDIEKVFSSEEIVDFQDQVMSKIEEYKENN